MMRLEDINEEELKIMFSDSKVKAVKYVREQTGCDLITAKEYVDRVYGDSTVNTGYSGNKISLLDKLKGLFK